ncbi:PAS domain S-box protein [Peteryoungia desertarenae]|uniref:histidine kinase n=1 Tax=Peteryoungia desertarenae TaxID=1813451 RepID=A0ABX6QLJ6_9HYPH|nr:PAS domain-containing sensor histidine kinase [Peteryoungia desertarenae]QLF69423.1 PAS domain S-box protein [Peteryoungia desertarenae]
MPAQYPFIDVAVHDSIRHRLARGEALVVFAASMEKVLWANGGGARLFGKQSIYDFIEDTPARADVIFRQVETTARQLQVVGERRSLVLRIGNGFQTVPVTASAQLVEIRSGEPVVLLSVPAINQGRRPNALASELVTGFDDPDTHIAVLDGEGHIVASSEGFARLDLTPHMARTLVNLVGADPDRLVKRPIPTGQGYMPAAIGRISDEPALHLVFIVETLPFVGRGDAHDELPETEADVVQAVSAIEEFEPALEEIRHDLTIGGAETEPPAPDEVGASDQSEDGSLTEEFRDQTSDTTEPNTGLKDDETETPGPEVVEVDRASALSATTPAELADEVAEFQFDPRRRASRFVWKIDADGRFTEVSSEFADAVGPRAAAINGAAFADLAALFGLDPEGKIQDLLKKRDTWSGKTIYWPVEGTSLVVPVDLAALPTYTRNREFDGFRGFGIVRIADAIEDPSAMGMTFVESHKTEELDEGQAKDLPVPFHFDSDIEDDQASDALAEDPQELNLTNEAGDARSIEQLDQIVDAHHDAPSEDAPDDALSFPRHNDRNSEPPVLRIMTPEQGPTSDKVVQLEERRSKGRDGLSASEQAAFQEIARKLDPMGLRARVEQSLTEPAPLKSGRLINISETKEPESQDVEESALSSAMPTQNEDHQEAEVWQEVKPEQQPDRDDNRNRMDEQAGASVPGDPTGRRERCLTGEIVDLMPLALLIHAGDRLIHANPEFLNLTGYADLFALESAGGLDALIQRREINGDTGHESQVMVVRADDRLVPVSARLQSVRFDETSALMLALVPQNSAERAQDVVSRPSTPPAQASELARLKVEVEELRSILETATDGVVILDSDGDIRSMNRAASALFNFDDMETRGKPFVMLFAHESQRSILDYLNGLSGHGVASVLNDGREVIGREASGGFLPLFMTIGKLTSSNGYCAVIRDITQWKRTEEELRSAKRAAETANAHKTDFLARVSHEIRTPLNAIIGFADMMANEHFGPVGHPRYGEYAHDIVRSGRHVLDIVNDLLDISKIEAGEMELDFTSVGLNETVQGAVSIIQPQANSQRVIIRTALSQSVPNIVADPRSIKQIVLNILANAIRFTPSGGQIIVSTSYETNGSVTLRIRDTGVGMSRAELEQAMKPFRQVSSGTPRNRGDGTGLGLPLTKAMVDANRAHFQISSAPNEGTLVEVTFPSPRVLAD